MITLYKKTHNITGLKYFGKTKNDDVQKYQGSGIYWQRHLKKYGYDVTTEIIFQNDDIEKIKEVAINYSKVNNIVESNEWANLKEELGTDGGSLKEWHTKESRAKMSKNRKGKVGKEAGWKHTNESLEKMSIKAKERCERDGPPSGAWEKGHIPWNKGRPQSQEALEKFRMQPKFKCPYCNKEFNKSNFSRWHGENCKQKQKKIK